MTRAFGLGLGWEGESATRRQGFPSWSWTGWNWKNSSPSWSFNRNLYFTSSDRLDFGDSTPSFTHIRTYFELQLKDGRRVALSGAKEFGALDSDDIDLLKVQSWSFNCCYRRKPSDRSSIELSGLPPVPTECSRSTSFVLTDLDVQAMDCKAIVLEANGKKGVWEAEGNFFAAL